MIIVALWEVSAPIMRNTCWLTQIENTSRWESDCSLLVVMSPLSGILFSDSTPETICTPSIVLVLPQLEPVSQISLIDWGFWVIPGMLLLINWGWSSICRDDQRLLMACVCLSDSLWGGTMGADCQTTRIPRCHIDTSWPQRCTSGVLVYSPVKLWEELDSDKTESLTFCLAEKTTLTEMSCLIFCKTAENVQWILGGCSCEAAASLFMQNEICWSSLWSSLLCES